MSRLVPAWRRINAAGRPFVSGLAMYIPMVYTWKMTQSSVFKSNKTQAVRLPKPVALPEHVKRVEVIRRGTARMIIPAGGGWAEFFASARLDADFLIDRAQPLPQRRNDRE